MLGVVEDVEDVVGVVVEDKRFDQEEKGVGASAHLASAR